MQQPINDRDIKHETDYELWSAFLAGDEEALGHVFVRYYNRLYLYGMNLTESGSEVQDAIQELFLNLWRQRAKINKAFSVEYYLLNSLRRIIFRQKKQILSVNQIYKEYARQNKLFFSSAEEKIIQKEEERERQDLFLKARHQLTDRQQEILYLRLQHGLTNEEIASILELSVQRVKNCLYEGTKKMREEVFRAILK